MARRDVAPNGPNELHFMARSRALSRALDACVEARSRDAFVDASRALRRAFARARERARSERANDEDEDDEDADVRAREDACACALRCGRGLWYESMREDDRRACVDAWFSREETEADARAGAGRGARVRRRDGDDAGRETRGKRRRSDRAERGDVLRRARATRGRGRVDADGGGGRRRTRARRKRRWTSRCERSIGSIGDLIYRCFVA